MSLTEDARKNADLTIRMFVSTHGLTLDYDERSVEAVGRFIEESGAKFDDSQRAQLVNFLGSFFGECVRRNYGGTWEHVDGEPGIRLDERNVVFPFDKIARQFENGREDSISSFYRAIPLIFKLNQ
jgi:hypothetical protein